MSDHDQDDITLGWRLVKDAASERQRSGGDRKPGRDRAPGRRSPPAPKRAQMIAFPLNRRASLVAKLAAQVASRSAEAGEEHLLQQLARQRDVLSRKGVPEKETERELRALAAAVRAELWRLLLGNGI